MTSCVWGIVSTRLFRQDDRLEFASVNLDKPIDEMQDGGKEAIILLTGGLTCDDLLR